MQLNLKAAEKAIELALEEDIGDGDMTSVMLVPRQKTGQLAMVAREELIACGVQLMPVVFGQVDTSLKVQWHVNEGQRVKAGTRLVSVSGSLRSILTAERTALNILQRMSSVATLTRQYVLTVDGTGAQILDTRKTMPCLRELDKFAVRIGGARNHRKSLADGVLIKDNHIASYGSIKKAVEWCRRGTPALTRIEVECETIAQVLEALEAGADMIMLDNMPLELMRKVAAAVRGKVPLEASGNITLQNVRQVAETGVQFISVGRLTHSAPGVDIGLDIQPATQTANAPKPYAVA